jgi:hypothetical protein
VAPQLFFQKSQLAFPAVQFLASAGDLLLEFADHVLVMVHGFFDPFPIHGYPAT